MRRSSIVCAIAAGTLALAPFSAALAAAAPQYISSDPANGAELHEAPESVSVSFSEPLDAESELRVFACGKRVDEGNSTVTLNQLEVSLASGPTGLYEARWVAEGFGGVTGSSAGLIEFSVGHGDVSCGGSGHGRHGGSGKGHGGGGEGHSGSGSGHEGGGSGQSGSGNSHSGSGSSHSGSGTSGSHSSGSTHSSGGHSGGASSSSDHGSGKHSSGSGKHGSGHGEGKDKGHGEGHGSSGSETTGEETAGNPNFAADGPLPITTPEAGAVLLALFACIGLGVTGGWLARLV